MTANLPEEQILAVENKITVNFNFTAKSKKITVLSFMSEGKNVGSLMNENGVESGTYDVELDFEGFASGVHSLTVEGYDPASETEIVDSLEGIDLEVKGLEIPLKYKYEPRARFVNFSPKISNILLPIISFDIELFLVKQGLKEDEENPTEYQFDSKQADATSTIRTFLNGKDVTSVTSFDQKNAQIKLSTPLQEGLNTIKAELSFQEYSNTQVELEHTIALDTTAPILEIDQSELFSRDLRPSFELTALDEISGIDDTSLTFEINGVDFPFECNVQDIEGNNKKKLICRLKSNLWEGRHTIAASISDHVGNRSEELSFDVFIDTIPPSIVKTIPQNNAVVNAKDPLFQIFFRDEQLPAIARRPIKEMLGIGGRSLKAYLDAGVYKIYQLLELNPNKNPIVGIKRVPLIRKISRARLVTDVEVDANVYRKLLHLTIYDVVAMSIEDIAKKGNVTIDKAGELYSKMSYLHNALDMGITKRVEIGQCTAVEGSGVHKVTMILDGTDVSNKVIVTSDRAEYRHDGNLTAGPHKIELIFEDGVGNEGKKVIEFIADDEGPEVYDINPKPATYVNKKEVSLFGKFADQISGVNVTSIQVILNGKDISDECKLTAAGFSAALTNLKEQEHKVEILVEDIVGNQRTVNTNFFYDTTPPTGYLDHELHLTATSFGKLKISGKITSEDAAYDTFQVEINGKKGKVLSDYSFSAQVNLQDGLNEVKAKISDQAGNFVETNMLSIFKTNELSTAVYGKLLDEDGKPLVSGRIYVEQTESWSLADSDGKFCIYTKPLKSGVNLIKVKPPEASTDTYQRLGIRKKLSYNKTYDLGNLVLLNAVVAQEGVELKSGSYTEINDSKGKVTIVMPPIESVIFPFDTGGKVAIRLLDAEDLPYKPAGFSTANHVLSLEPSGLKIIGENEATLEFNNLNNLDPDTTIPLYSFDHLTGRYKIAAMARVSHDGEKIKTIPGHGIRSFSEKALSVYEPQIEVLEEAMHQQGFNTLNNGLTVDVALPSFKYMNKEVTPGLVYNSRTADPTVNVSGIFKGLKRVKSFKKLEHTLNTQTQKGKKVILDLYSTDFRFLPGNLSKPDQTVIQYFGLEDDPISTLSEDEQLRDFDGFYTISSNVVTLYEIEWEIIPEVETNMWPRSIQAEYFMGDQKSDEITIYGKPVTYKVEDTTIDTYELPLNLAINATIEPPIDLPTGIYSFLAKYSVAYDGYNLIRYSSIAKSMFIDPGFIVRMKNVREEVTDPDLRAKIDEQISFFDKVSNSLTSGEAMPEEMQVRPMDTTDLLNRSNAGSIIINNQSQSPLGRGWVMKDVARIIPVDHFQALLIEGERALNFSIRDTLSVKLYNEAKSFCLLGDGRQALLKYEDKVSLFDLDSQTEVSIISHNLSPIENREEKSLQTKVYKKISWSEPVWAYYYLSIPYPCGISWSGIKWCHHRIIGGRFVLYHKHHSRWDLMQDWKHDKDSPSSQKHENTSLIPQLEGMVKDANGDVFVADAGTHRIYKLTKANDYKDWEVVVGRIQEIKDVSPDVRYTRTSGNSKTDYLENKTEWTYLADTGFSADGTLAKEASIYSPFGLAIDKEGDLIFSEKGHHRIRKINKEGRLETVAGDGSIIFNPAINDAKNTGIPSPGSLCLDTEGNVVCLIDISKGDDLSQGLVKVDPNGNLIHMAGNPNGSTTTGINGQLFKLDDAHQVICDDSDLCYLYINAGTYSKILKIDERGLIHEFAGGSNTDKDENLDPLDASIGSDGHMAFTSNGNLLIMDSGKLRQVTRSFLEAGATKMRGPIGYFDSTLERNADGSWIRQFKGGKKAYFDSQGLQQKTVIKGKNEINYAYDEKQNLVKIDFDKGQFIALSYSPDGKLQQITDHAGRQTDLIISGKDLIEVNLPDQRTLKFTYDESGKILSKEER
ncbi:MAG: hypothetical protein ABJH98_04230 [Reichenbachiella sp.]|uniref:hypothetical protein n=1 Tax=Reichenbachiella sp. TaxID=2184521 RepID=UPI00329929A6